MANQVPQQGGMPSGLSIEDQRRLEYEAAHSLAKDYYSGGQAVGSLLLTFSVGIFAASAGLLEEVAPLQATDLDPVLFAGWGVLAAAMLLSLVFMVTGRYSQKRYIQFLWMQAQTRPTDAAVLAGNTEEAEKLQEMYTERDKSRKWSSRIARVRDFFLGLNIMALLTALLLLGSFAALAPESGGDEDPGGGRPQRDFIIEDVEFPETLEPTDECLATIDLALESPSSSFTIYPVFDDQPLTSPQHVDLEREEPVGAPTSVCVRTPPDFPFHEPMDPLDVEILVDMGEEILFPEPVPGLLPELRTSVEYAIIHPWTPPPD